LIAYLGTFVWAQGVPLWWRRHISTSWCYNSVMSLRGRPASCVHNQSQEGDSYKTVRKKGPAFN
jgi:hypothetical protein